MWGYKRENLLPMMQLDNRLAWTSLPMYVCVCFFFLSLLLGANTSNGSYPRDSNIH
jgi:hypothetical protein